ncbi:uncharacterized protein LOC111062131 isoform X3 [Nilaparvata lugens]|uniref:uncharacterized protein LOC111062131 isoform X3 n=1 Tax=Nilaparvata lugens TaxID=108931 RepID=UPI00193DF889|nr:uncharacterized protein LOC111062131 isoform X3 [Nilaparvata lugens]
MNRWDPNGNSMIGNKQRRKLRGGGGWGRRGGGGGGGGGWGRRGGGGWGRGGGGGGRGTMLGEEFAEQWLSKNRMEISQTMWKQLKMGCELRLKKLSSQEINCLSSENMEKDPDFQMEVEGDGEEEEDEEEDGTMEANEAEVTSTSDVPSASGSDCQTSGSDQSGTGSARATRHSVNPDFAAKHRRFLSSVSDSLKQDDLSDRHVGRSRERSAGKSLAREQVDQLPSKPQDDTGDQVLPSKSVDDTGNISDEIIGKEGKLSEVVGSDRTLDQTVSDSSGGNVVEEGNLSEFGSDNTLDPTVSDSRDGFGVDSSEKVANVTTETKVLDGPMDKPGETLNPAGKSRTVEDDVLEKTATKLTHDSFEKKFVESDGAADGGLQDVQVGVPHNIATSQEEVVEIDDSQDKCYMTADPIMSESMSNDVEPVVESCQDSCDTILDKIKTKVLADTIDELREMSSLEGSDKLSDELEVKLMKLLGKSPDTVRIPNVVDLWDDSVDSTDRVLYETSVDNSERDNETSVDNSEKDNETSGDSSEKDTVRTTSRDESPRILRIPSSKSSEVSALRTLRKSDESAVKDSSVNRSPTDKPKGQEAPKKRYGNRRESSGKMASEDDETRDESGVKSSETSADGSSSDKPRGQESAKKRPANRRESSGNRRESSGNRRESSGNRRELSGNRRESSGNRREFSGNRRESSGKIAAEDVEEDEDFPSRAIRSRSRFSDTRKRRRGEDGNGEEEKEKEEAEEAKDVEEESRKPKKRSLEKMMDSTPKPIREGKDMYCWKCHREGTAVACKICPRAFHLRCLHLDAIPPCDWVCPECSMTLYAENTETRSPAMKSLTLDQLCNLLKYVVARMLAYEGSEWFAKPVDTTEFKEYRKFVVNPMDLSILEKGIRQKCYGSTHAFMADTRWMLHNSVVFNTFQSKLTHLAKTLVKICKQELDEIETCPECYLNAHTRSDTWFVEACKRPHLLVWAKLKGFPFWPGKVVKTNADNSVDVRFFGAHDRAWIPVKNVYLFSKLNPCSAKHKSKKQFDDCMIEVQQHIKKLRDRFGEFVYPPFKCLFDASKEEEQLEAMLPGYKAASRRYGKLLGPCRNFSTPSTSSHGQMQPKKELSVSARRRAQERNKRRVNEGASTSQTNSSKLADCDEDMAEDRSEREGEIENDGKKIESRTSSPKIGSKEESKVTDPTKGSVVTENSPKKKSDKEDRERNVEKEKMVEDVDDDDDDDDDEPLAKRLHLAKPRGGEVKLTPTKTDHAASLQEKLQIMLSKEKVVESLGVEETGDVVEDVEEKEENNEKEESKFDEEEEEDNVDDADLESGNDDGGNDDDDDDDNDDDHMSSATDSEKSSENVDEEKDTVEEKEEESGSEKNVDSAEASDDKVDVSTKDSEDGVNVSTKDSKDGVNVSSKDSKDGVNVSSKDSKDGVNVSTEDSKDGVNVTTKDSKDGVNVSTKDSKDAVDVSPKDSKDGVNVSSKDSKDGVDDATKEGNEVSGEVKQANDTENVSKDTEEVSKDTEKVSKDTAKISKDTEKVSKDKEIVVEDEEEIVDESKDKVVSECKEGDVFKPSSDKKIEEKEKVVGRVEEPQINLVSDDEEVVIKQEISEKNEEQQEESEKQPEKNESPKFGLVICDIKSLTNEAAKEFKKAVVQPVSKPKALDTIRATIDDVVKQSILMTSKSPEKVDKKSSESQKPPVASKLTGIVDNLNHQFSRGMEKLSRNSSITIEPKRDSIVDHEDIDLDIDSPKLISMLRARDPEELERAHPSNRRKGFPSKVRRNGSSASSSCSSDVSSVDELKRACAEQELRGENDRKRPSTTPIDELTDDSYSVLDEIVFQVSGQFMKKRMEKGNVTITLVTSDEDSPNKQQASTNKAQPQLKGGSVCLSKDVSLSIVREEIKKDLGLDMECEESDTDDKDKRGRKRDAKRGQVQPTARKSFPNSPHFGSKPLVTTTLDGGSEMIRRLSAAEAQALIHQNGASSSPRDSPSQSPKIQSSASSAFYTKISQIAANSQGTEEVQISKAMSVKIHSTSDSSKAPPPHPPPPPAIPLTAATIIAVSSNSNAAANSLQSIVNSSRSGTTVTQAARVLPQVQQKPSPAAEPSAFAAAGGRGGVLRGNFGPASGRMDAISQKLSDSMLQLMEDMLQEMAQEGHMDAQLHQLQLKLELAEWRHRQNIAEHKHNADLLLMEMRAAAEAEKQRLILDMKQKFQIEKEAAIEETKMKQWCAHCRKEALFYCCWNTAYCNYPCQQEHWTQHMPHCAQNRAITEATGTTVGIAPAIGITPALGIAPGVSTNISAPAVKMLTTTTTTAQKAPNLQNQLQVAATTTLMATATVLASQHEAAQKQQQQLVAQHVAAQQQQQQQLIAQQQQQQLAAQQAAAQQQQLAAQQAAAQQQQQLAAQHAAMQKQHAAAQKQQKKQLEAAQKQQIALQKQHEAAQKQQIALQQQHEAAQKQQIALQQQHQIAAQIVPLHHHNMTQQQQHQQMINHHHSRMAQAPMMAQQPPMVNHHYRQPQQQQHFMVAPRGHQQHHGGYYQ